MNSTEIRRENARMLAAQYGGLTKLGEKLGRSDSQISQIIGERPIRGIGGRLARTIEKKLGLPDGWMDVQHTEARENGSAADLSKKALAIAKEWQELNKINKEIIVMTIKQLRKVEHALHKKKPTPGIASNDEHSSR